MVFLGEDECHIIFDEDKIRIINNENDFYSDLITGIKINNKVHYFYEFKFNNFKEINNIYDEIKEAFNNLSKNKQKLVIKFLNQIENKFNIASIIKFILKMQEFLNVKLSSKYGFNGKVYIYSAKFIIMIYLVKKRKS